ncbi:MAG: hypothetical protein BGO01_05115 [Armatimonadetes bacterium 55-13]|nr:MAG: hypothetical protein BGO01_05115 [Armatimonadetes bacterium 55-13]
MFVLTLTVLAGLVSVLALAAASQRSAAIAQSHRMEIRRAKIAAEAGIQRALAEFQNLTTTSPTTLSDDWAALGQNGSEDFTLGSANFRMEIVDAASLININTATQEQLELLPLTGEQVDCLLDWREEGVSPRSDGAKDEYYNQLEKPYNTKLGAFSSVDELLLVKGFTADTLYNVQTDVVNTARPVRTTNGDSQQLPLEQLVTVDSTSQAVNSSGQAKLNVNTAQVNQIAQRANLTIPVATQIVNSRPGGGYTNIGAVLAVPGITIQNARDILNNLTTGGQNLTGKLNLNTVTQEVLDTVPNLPPDAASAIITRQSTGFTDLGDLLDVPGMNNLALLQQTAGFFEVNSQSFLVRVLGVAGATKVALQATLTITNGQAKLVRIERPPYGDIIGAWGWDTDPTSTTALKENQ